MTEPKPKRTHPPGTSPQRNRYRTEQAAWIHDNVPYPYNKSREALITAIVNGKVQLVFPDNDQREGCYGTKEKEQ
jgi:hypothetical protein